MRRAVAAVVALLVAGCAAGPDLPPVPAYDAEGLARLRYQAVIIGGDASINAFDNAAERMAKDLLKANAIAPAGLHRYSARPRRPPAILLASVGNVLDGIAALKPAAGQGCLVFATAHGADFHFKIVGIHARDCCGEHFCEHGRGAWQSAGAGASRVVR